MSQSSLDAVKSQIIDRAEADLAAAAEGVRAAEQRLRQAKEIFVLAQTIEEAESFEEVHDILSKIVRLDLNSGHASTLTFMLRFLPKPEVDETKVSEVQVEHLRKKYGYV